jgi:peroxiredoxin
MNPAGRRALPPFAVLAVLALGLAVPAQAAVGVGAALPDVTFQDLSGHAVQTAELRGKPVVIAFWATWCRSCKTELDHLKTVRATYGEDRLRIIAVSLDDDRETLDLFLSTRTFPFPIYSDPEAAAASRFTDDTDQLPLTVVADAQGVVRSVARDFAEGAAARLDAAVAGVLAPASP